MGILFLRSSAAAAASSWEDVTVGFTDMPAQLATDGRKVRMDLTGTDWGAVEDDINGASVTRVVGGAYDGTDCVRIVPPSSSLDNGNKTTYSCIMRGLDLANGGTKSTGQVTLGFCVKYGSRYWDLGHQAKVTGVIAAQSVGGAPNATASRAAVFEAFRDLGASDLRRCFSVTATTVAEYYDPPQGGFQGDHPDADLLMLLGSTTNHSNDPPLVGSEWLYFEQQVDYRQDGSNPNGRNRLDVWSLSTGYLGKIDIPLTTRPDWDFSYAYASQIEYIGGLWNSPGTANANNYLDVSHPIVSVNRTWGNRIGAPWDA